MKTPHRKTYLLNSIFLISLLVLLINDLIFKDHYHNWLTGKLSDFSGLIVFTLFGFYLFPKSKKAVVSGVMLLFIMWKSPVSESFIDWWNQWAPFGIQRVVDYSDLVALIPLPMLVRYRFKSIRIPYKNLILYPVLGCTLFSFCATSYYRVASGYYYGREFKVDMSKEEFISKTNELNLELEYDTSMSFQGVDHYTLDSWVLGEDTIPRITFTLENRKDHIVLTLLNIYHGLGEVGYPGYPPGGDRHHKKQLKKQFKEEFVKKVR